MSSLGLLRHRRAFDVLWLIVCGLLSSAWCVTAAGQLGATFDEPIYVTRGLDGWRTGSHAGLLRLGTMPLPVDLQTLPLYLWERWSSEQIDPEKDLERILPTARALTLCFWWLLLWYGWRAGRALAGRWGGHLAAALLACEPNLLAHAALATTDIAVTACLLALVYHFRMGREAGWVHRVGLPMLWFAAAVLAKASGLVFGVLCLTAVEVERLARAGAFARPASSARTVWDALRPFRRDVAFILCGGLLLVFLYCGSDWQPHPSFVAWAQRLPEGWQHDTAAWSAEHLRIFSNAGEGLVRQVKHNLHGHGVYLLGRTDAHAIWYYFPVVLTIKLSVPLLAAVILLSVFRWRALLNWAFVAALLLLVFSLTCRVQLGVRLMLPLVALATVGVAAALIQTWRTLPFGLTRNLVRGAIAGGLAWTATSALLVWPDGLCYVNELWGGTSSGYVYVSETNYDWGQGLKQLDAWRREHGLERLGVWYFGTDPELARLPLDGVALHALPLHQAEDVRAHVSGGYFAVSTSLLYGNVCDTDGHRCAVEFLRRQRPMARTRTFLIYDFRSE